MESKYRFIYMVIGLLAIIGAGIGIYYIMKDKKEDNSASIKGEKNNEKNNEKKDEKNIADKKNVDKKEAEKKENKELNVIVIKNNDKKNVEQQKTEQLKINNQEKAAIPSTTNAKPNNTTKTLLDNTQNKETTNTNLNNQENKTEKNVTAENKKNLQRQAENKLIVEQKENVFDVKENLTQLKKEFEEFKNSKTIPNDIEKINMAEKLIKFDRTLHSKLKIDYALPIEKALAKLNFDLFNYIVLKNLNLNYNIKDNEIEITFNIDKYDQKEIYNKIYDEFHGHEIYKLLKVENSNIYFYKHEKRINYLYNKIKVAIHNYINKKDYLFPKLTEDLKILNLFLKFNGDENFNYGLVFLNKFQHQIKGNTYQVKLNYEIINEPKEEDIISISDDTKILFDEEFPEKIFNADASNNYSNITFFFFKWLENQKFFKKFNDEIAEDLRNLFLTKINQRRFDIEKEEKLKSESAYQNAIKEFKVDY